MLFETKKARAKELGIEFAEDITEDALDLLLKAAKKAAAEKNVPAPENKEPAPDKKEKVVVEEVKEDGNIDVVLLDVDGNPVDQYEYFFPSEKTKNTAPKFFNKICGSPVRREELLKVFNNVFNKDKKFLFYKQDDKEVYLVIVPRKYANSIGVANESAPGDFQKHAISFLNEGSVNLDTLKMKLTKIATHSSIAKEPLQY